MVGTGALGFISMQFVGDDGERLVMCRRLNACADEHAVRLLKVYVEQSGQPAAAYELLGELVESDGLALVGPTLHHLALLGNPLEIRDQLQRAGHDVLIALKPAERTCRGDDSSFSSKSPAPRVRSAAPPEAGDQPPH
ncbi:hypothetical protein GCM10029976_010140 [Kribbella albertanoniae]